MIEIGLPETNLDAIERNDGLLAVDALEVLPVLPSEPIRPWAKTCAPGLDGSLLDIAICDIKNDADL